MNLSQKCLPVCFMLIFLWSHSGVAQKTLLLQDNQQVINLAPYLYYQLDTTHQLSLKDIQKEVFQKKFILNTQSTLHLGKGIKTAWLKFGVQVPNTGKYLVEFRNIPIEEAALYYQIAGSKGYTLVGKVGDKIPFGKRKIKATNYLSDSRK